MFCFAKQKLLITSDNTAYPAMAFYKSHHPNASHFGYADTLSEICFSFYG